MTAAGAVAHYTITPAGFGAAPLWERVAAKNTCVREFEDERFSSKSFFAAKLSAEQWREVAAIAGAPLLTPFEQLCIAAGRQTLAAAGVSPQDVRLFLSTTKGNIAQLNELPDERMHLHSSALQIAAALGINADPVVISQACVSGVVALMQAQRLIQTGRCRVALVIGADVFSRFVLHGFRSFHATDTQPCRPFDSERNGINLGEGAAAILLSADEAKPLARLRGAASSNDANHISGPSRTGEELALAVTRALQEACIAPEAVNAISAHGTATAYNDEMEARAFAAAGVLHAPVHSLKGITGHTLGAAGVLECIMAIEMLQRQALLPSAGFESLGVSKPVHVTQSLTPAVLSCVLKTASGFGGSNAAAVWMKP